MTPHDELMSAVLALKKRVLDYTAEFDPHNRAEVESTVDALAYLCTLMPKERPQCLAHADFDSACGTCHPEAYPRYIAGADVLKKGSLDRIQSLPESELRKLWGDSSEGLRPKEWRLMPLRYLNEDVITAWKIFTLESGQPTGGDIVPAHEEEVSFWTGLELVRLHNVLLGLT